MWQGVSQGGVLSLVLYAVYTKDIGKDLDKDIQILQYADDIAIYNKGNGEKEQKERLKKGIEKVRKQLRDLNLELEDKKRSLSFLEKR